MRARKSFCANGPAPPPAAIFEQKIETKKRWPIKIFEEKKQKQTRWPIKIPQRENFCANGPAPPPAARRTELPERLLL